MAKVLKVTFLQKCIGCELCIFEIQRQLNKVGLEGSPIRIFKSADPNDLLGEIVFKVELDPVINEYDIKKLVEICPTQVFTIQEIDSKEEGTLLE